MKLGDYDTAANEWTLTGWSLETPQPKTHYVDKPGGDGTWDLSTALTDGVLRYNDRKLTATFECSEGDRLYRDAKIRQMINQLDGMQVHIELPDDPDHYLVGRLQISKNYSDPAHCSVSLVATCEPWKYNQQETTIKVTTTLSMKAIDLSNNGRRVVVPTLVCAGAEDTLIRYAGVDSVSLKPGRYEWPSLQLAPGITRIWAWTSGDEGLLGITYREAVLE